MAAGWTRLSAAVPAGLRQASTRLGLRARWRWGLTGLSALAFAAALMQPGFTWPARVGTTLLVVDITQSMGVLDMHDPDSGLAAATGLGQGRSAISRLDYTRALLRRVLRELPCGHRAGVGVFTERKTLVLLDPVEVCGHYAALEDVLGQLSERMAWAADSHLYYGTYSALDEIGRRLPGAALAFFSDGHQAPVVAAGAEPRFERGPTTPPGVLFGVGGLVPMPVPRTDSNGRITGYWTAEDAAAFAVGGPRPTLSALDMERMAAGQDVRNGAQRPAGAVQEHLSARHDEVLDAVARITGLERRTADGADTVVSTLLALPGGRIEPQWHALHTPLVMLAMLSLLASLVPSFLQPRLPPP